MLHYVKKFRRLRNFSRIHCQTQMFRKLRTISRCFFSFLGIIIAVSSTQLSFYVSAINHQFKTDIDNPTIGLLFCKDKDNVVAKYALDSYKEPMGISEYQLSKLFPKDFKSSMPTIEELEKGLKDNRE